MTNFLEIHIRNMHFQEKIGHRGLFIMSALFPNAMETLNPSVWTTNRDRNETKKKKGMVSSIFRMEIFDEKIFYFLFTFFFFFGTKVSFVTIQ